MDDPFAALRTVDTGQRTAPVGRLFQPKKHLNTGDVFARNPQESAEKHNKHEKPTQESASPELSLSATQEWADGLARLRAMNRPSIASPDRWQQIVADAERVAFRCERHAIDLGWRLVDFFAFDLDPDRNWEGIITKVYGGDVLVVDQEMAVITRSNGSRCWHYKSRIAPIPDGAPLLWEPRRWK